MKKTVACYTSGKEEIMVFMFVNNIKCVFIKLIASEFEDQLFLSAGVPRSRIKHYALGKLTLLYYLSLDKNCQKLLDFYSVLLDIFLIQ